MPSPVGPVPEQEKWPNLASEDDVIGNLKAELERERKLRLEAEEALRGDLVRVADARAACDSLHDTFRQVLAHPGPLTPLPDYFEYTLGNSSQMYQTRSYQDAYRENESLLARIEELEKELGWVDTILDMRKVPTEEYAAQGGRRHV